MTVAILFNGSIQLNVIVHIFSSDHCYVVAMIGSMVFISLLDTLSDCWKYCYFVVALKIYAISSIFNKKGLPWNNPERKETDWKYRYIYVNWIGTCQLIDSLQKFHISWEKKIRSTYQIWYWKIVSKAREWGTFENGKKRVDLISNIYTPPSKCLDSMILFVENKPFKPYTISWKGFTAAWLPSFSRFLCDVIRKFDCWFTLFGSTARHITQTHAHL